MIDDKISLDFPVDAFLHTAYSGLDMRRIHNIVVTHGHYDHFLTQDLFSRPQGYQSPLRIYATEASATKMCETLAAQEAAYASGKRVRTSDFTIEYHPVEVGVPFMIDEYRFTALKAHHAQGVQPVMYVIENTAEGKHLLWAHDTGPFYPSALEWLAEYPHVFDFISFDCTLGKGELITASHMDILGCNDMKQRLEKLGRVDGHTKIYLSHIGHLLHQTHAEVEADAAAFGMAPAYDGLTVEL